MRVRRSRPGRSRWGSRWSGELDGLWLAINGQDVNACTGGSREITAMDLQDRYHTHCDPRLNNERALDLAFKVAEKLAAKR